MKPVFKTCAHALSVLVPALCALSFLAAPVSAVAKNTATPAATTAATTSASTQDASDGSSDKGEEEVAIVLMNRLYNPYSGEHFYTSNVAEKNNLVSLGWKYEGIGWNAPETSDTPVYRLYNRYAGDHHYTMSATERDSLVKVGWTYEGVGWYSDDDETVPLYRQYNPYATTGTHNYTTSKTENDKLVKLGWKGEGYAWYAVSESSPIMGESLTTAAQMVAYYKSTVGESAYPAEVYKDKGAATISDFCKILMEEAAAEGVRAEVVFCQAMKETGWLKFGGDVKAEQCNFAGIGATGGVTGATFESVRIGLRAQIQHLKAYASTDKLVNECVDPRFNLVKRGCAPTVEDLGNKWAAGNPNYGVDITSMIKELFTK